MLSLHDAKYIGLDFLNLHNYGHFFYKKYSGPGKLDFCLVALSTTTVEEKQTTSISFVWK